MPQDSTRETNGSTSSTSFTPNAGATADLGKARDAIVEGAHHITDEMKHVAADAAAHAKKAAETRLDAGRDFAAEHLGLVADALRKTGDELRSNDSVITEYVTKAATSVDQVSQYLQTRTLSQLMGDVEGFARREPAMFLGGSFLAGLLGGRFLKSATPARATGLGTTACGKSTSVAVVPALPAFMGDRPSHRPWEVAPPSSSTAAPSTAAASTTPSSTAKSTPLASTAMGSLASGEKPTTYGESPSDARTTLPNKQAGTNGGTHKAPLTGAR